MQNKLEKQFLQAYDELSDAIFRHCYFRVFNRERAKDLMQDTFARTWEYLSKGSVQNLKAFLYRVANNLIIDESRKKKEESLEMLQENSSFDPGEDLKDRLIDFMEGKEVIKLLDKIDPKYRLAISMRYIDDLSPKEISEVLDETENNISVRIHRGLKQLRELTKEKND